MPHRGTRTVCGFVRFHRQTVPFYWNPETQKSGGGQNRLRWAGPWKLFSDAASFLLDDVGTHLVAGGLDAVDPLLLGHAAGHQRVDGDKKTYFKSRIIVEKR